MQKTRFPKGHTRCHWATKNMSRELLGQASRVAGLRAASGLAGATIESVVLDALTVALPKLETQADDHRQSTKRARR